MPTQPVRVVVVGAGPSGLLACINFLNRNANSNDVTYHVTLVERGEDYGALDASGLEKKRSWMIGLSTHGLTAIRRVPSLYEEYVSKVGVPVHATALCVGSRKFEAKSDEIGENYVVDRNFVVAAIARFLKDKFETSKYLTQRYNTKVNFVDSDERRIFVRDQNGKDEYIPYDLLIGCDGVRSQVRAALVANHRDFESSVGDIFNRYKSVHIELPEHLDGNMIYITPQCLPNFNGIALPETGGKVNLAMGCPTSAKVPAALESDDVTAVADYLRDNFKAFALPCEAVAKQWVAQPWNTTGMVHCNFYHSSTLRLAIMGDAAHATSPSIGQGMNTALADAAAFDDLLDRHYDDIDAVLPAFSKERVKEGNALTSIAYYVYPMSDFQNLRNTVVNILRNILHRYLPSLVAPDPLVSIGKGGKLSEAYAEMTRMGRLAAARRVNDDLRRGWFEKRVGLIKA